MMLVPIVFTILIAQAGALQPPAPPASQAESPWPPAGVYRQKDPGVTMPKLIKEVHPNYLAEALRLGIQGSVLLEAIVQTDGTVGEVRVTRSLDRASGMDEEAVNCLKKWRFSPGKKGDVPVAVMVEIEMTFTIRGKR